MAFLRQDIKYSVSPTCSASRKGGITRYMPTCSGQLQLQASFPLWNEMVLSLIKLHASTTSRSICPHAKDPGGRDQSPLQPAGAQEGWNRPGHQMWTLWATGIGDVETHGLSQKLGLRSWNKRREKKEACGSDTHSGYLATLCFPEHRLCIPSVYLCLSSARLDSFSSQLVMESTSSHKSFPDQFLSFF